MVTRDLYLFPNKISLHACYLSPNDQTNHTIFYYRNIKCLEWKPNVSMDNAFAGCYVYFSSLSRFWYLVLFGSGSISTGTGMLFQLYNHNQHIISYISYIIVYELFELNNNLYQPYYRSKKIFWIRILWITKQKSNLIDQKSFYNSKT